MNKAQDSNLIKTTTDWINQRYDNADHLLRTGYWVKQLDPNAGEALIIAAITHDVERTFKENRQPPTIEYGKWDDPTYNLWHGKRSAKFVRLFLQKQNVDENLINQVCDLIKIHEDGGTNDANILSAADSISFLEINTDKFIAKIPNEISKQSVREKFDYMYNRIKSDKGKKLAQKFYHQAIKKLNQIKT